MSTQIDTWFESFYRENYDMLHRLARHQLSRSLGYDTGTHDVVQDVFIAAFKQSKVLMSHPNPRGWLIKTTVNLCRNHARAYRRETVKYDHFRQAAIASYCASDKLDHSAASDLKIALKQSLSQEDLKLIKAYCLERQSVDDISRELGTTPNAVRVRIFRIRKVLQNILTALFVIFPYWSDII